MTKMVISIVVNTVVIAMLVALTNFNYIISLFKLS